MPLHTLKKQKFCIESGQLQEIYNRETTEIMTQTRLDYFHYLNKGIKSKTECIFEDDLGLCQGQTKWFKSNEGHKTLIM